MVSVNMKRRMIYHQNYTGEERRNEHMKVKNFITPTTITTAIVALIAIIGYKFTIEATASQVKFHTEQIATTDKNVNVIDKRVVKLETEIPAIKESIIRIETSQIETQKDIKKLLSKMQ